jgi:hypothetical protein
LMDALVFLWWLFRLYFYFIFLKQTLGDSSKETHTWRDSCGASGGGGGGGGTRQFHFPLFLWKKQLKSDIVSLFFFLRKRAKKLIKNTTKFDTQQIHTFGARLLPLLNFVQSILFLHFCLWIFILFFFKVGEKGFSRFLRANLK